MSGTSLDGMDLAACSFLFRNGNWEYVIEHASINPYIPAWKNKLKSLMHADARDLAQAHFDFGKLTGEFALHFHHETGFDPLLVASHGHTIFHKPSKGYTFQLGSGAAIAAICEKPVVCDFRAVDICLGGQGAPLVPIGDQLLFHQYNACLNLGGFSNISFNRNGKRIAFDICPVNTVLNQFAKEFGQDFDKHGEMARQGKLIPSLLEALNNLPYYSQSPPKSFGAEWLEENIYPIIKNVEASVKDKLRTFIEHIAFQISKVISKYGITSVLVSGGGAYNTFLIEILETRCQGNLIIPDPKTIEYKEALIFALLGLLRWLNQNNCLASATGARHDSVGGAVYLPIK